MSWSKYKFLESATNLKAAIKAALGAGPNTGTATDIATCLQQGRQFFEAAERAPLEIRPLLVQYGVIAMGKALASSRSLRALGTFTKSHGLTDTTDDGAKLGDLKVLVGDSGSFQEFNDAVRNLDCVTYFGSRYEPLRVYLEWAPASALAEKTVTFDDLFSRLPGQAELYKQTFDREPNWLRSQFTTGTRRGEGQFTALFKGHHSIDRPTLKAIVQRLREQNDFLNQWVLAEVTCSWGDLFITFASYDEPIQGDVDEPLLIERGTGDGFKINALNPKIRPWQADPPPMCDSLANPLTGPTHGSIHPLHGARLSSYSIMYLATFMLGSLVRYKPETWVHALASRVTGERELDDRAVALVEAFLADVLGSFPALIVNGITTRRENVEAA